MVRQATVAVAVALAALFAAGCSSPSRPAAPTPQCKYNSDCPTGNVCLPGGTCARECLATRDCVIGWACRSNVCVDSRSCTVAGDCPNAGDTCTNGFCSTPCTVTNTCPVGPFDTLVNRPSVRISAAGGSIWTTTTDGGAARVASGSATIYGASEGQLTGTTSSVALENGGPVTALDFAGKGSTLTSVTGPVGILSATWPGGTVTSWTGLDRVTGSIDKVGGVLTGASFAGATRLASTTDSKYYLRAQTISDGRFQPSSIVTDTGVVTAVTATTVTTSATLVPDALVGKVLVGRGDTDAYNQTRSAPITGNTASTITVQGGGTDLTTLMTVNRRWFAVSSNYPYYPTYTVTAATAATNGQILDCYDAGAPLWDSSAESYRYYYGAWTVANATASTFQLTAPLTRWAMFADVPARGFCILGSVVNGAGSVSVTVTDPGGAFDPMQPGTLDRILVEGNSLLMPVVSTTPTSVTFAAPGGAAADFGVGQTFRLGVSSAVRVTVSPVNGAVVGQYLHVDTAGYRYLVREVNGSAATIDVSPSYATFPLNWIGTWAAPTPTGAALPLLTVTDPTYTTAGALVGQAIVVVDAQPPIRYSSSYRLTGVGVVTSNDAAGNVTVSPATCNAPTYQCPNRLRNLLGGLPGLRWQTGYPGSASYSYPTGYSPYDAAAHFTVTPTPSPGWIPDALAGTTLYLDGFAGSGAVQRNDASSALVQVPDGASFTAFDTAVPGVGFLVSGSGTSTRVTVTDATATLTADAWRGYDLVTAGGSVVGPVLANGATTLQIGVTSASALAELAAGSRYALSRPPGPSSSASLCSPHGYIDATAQLAGATLTPSSYDTVTVTGATALRVTGNTASELALAICPSQLDDLLQGLGKPAAASALDAVTLKLADSGGALASAAGKRIVFFGNASGSYSPVTTQVVTAADASGATLTTTGAGALSYAAATGVGARFALADAAGVPVAVTATLPAAATGADHALAGRFVTLLLPGSTHRVVRVRDNGSGSTTVSVDPGDARMLSGETAFAPRFLLTSPGGTIRMVVQGGGLTAGALVGRQLLARMPDYSSLAFEIVDNTATDLVAAYYNPFFAVAALAAPAWLVPGLSVGSQAQNALAALPSGEALVGAQTAAPEVWRLGATTAVTTRLGSGTRLAVAPATVTTGTVPATTSATLPVLSSAGWSFTAGALRGARLITRPGGSGDWMAFAIVDNDVSTITLRNTYGYTLTQGTPFTVDPGDLVVSGTTLTPGALAGKTLWSGGVAYRIRSNGASTLRLALDASTGYTLQQGLSYAYTYAALPPGAGPTPAYVLSGLGGSTLYALAADGAGYWAGTDAGLAHFDGSAWTQFGDADTATQVAAGTITGYGASYDTVVDAAASYATNALQSKRLVTPAGVFTIQSNTAKEIRLASYTDAAFPVVGESYRVVESDGLGTVYDVAVTGGAVLAGTDRGLARYQSSAFTFWTPANTESAPGKNDGVRGPVHRLAASSPTDAWLATHGSPRAVVHWNGTTWTAYTVASTESSYARGDGLPSDSVNGLFLQDASTTWFATGAGAARLAGTAWTRYGPADGFPAGVYSVYVDGAGAVHLATSVGLIRLR